EDNFVTVTIERSMKFRVTIIGRAEDHVEHHQARTRPKQSIEQKRPDLPRPREWPFGHQLKRAIACNFFSRQRRQLQCALIKSEKDEIARRDSLSAFAPKQIIETLFTAPRRREKRRCCEKMADKNQAGPKKANQRQDKQPMPTKR